MDTKLVSGSFLDAAGYLSFHISHLFVCTFTKAQQCYYYFCLYPTREPFLTGNSNFYTENTLLLFITLLTLSHTHTHTHPFNGPCPGLPRWAGTRKVKPIWILLKQEVSGSGNSWAICKSAPCSRQITKPTPHRSVFYRPDALPVAQPTASNHWRHFIIIIITINVFVWQIACQSSDDW